MKNNARNSNKFSSDLDPANPARDAYRGDLLTMIEKLGARVERQRETLAKLHADVDFSGRHGSRVQVRRPAVSGKPKLRLVK